MKAQWIKRNFAHALAALGLAAAATSVAAADPYPSKPVRIIVPSAPGGGADIPTRLFAQKMSERLGQPVIVENRPGADTLLGTRAAKDLPADGYTLLTQANGYTVFPTLKLNPGYEYKDFTAVGLMVRGPKLLVVSAEHPIRNVADLVARAKAGRLTYGSGGVGTPAHLAAALFAKQVGVDLHNVPYKGTGAALPDVAAGRVDLMFDNYLSSLPYLQSGKLRALAFTSATRVAAMPDVPTVQEQGIDFTNELWLGLIVRSGTPKEAIARLSDAMRYAANSKDMRERLLREGWDPSFLTPDETNSYIAREVAQMEKLVGELKIPKE